MWDDDGVRGRERAAHFGVTFEPDLDRLLARSDIQAVSICAEPDLNPRLAAAAASAGKDVLVEKAMAGDLEGAGRVVMAEQTSGVRVMPASSLHWTPAAVLVKRLLDEGVIGRLTRIRRSHNHYGYADATTDHSQVSTRFGWRDRPGEKTGALFFVAPHASLWWVWMAGTPTWASAMASTNVNGSPWPDTVVASFQHGDDGRGPVGVLEATQIATATGPIAELHGADGVIVQHRGDTASTRVWNPDATAVSWFDRHSETWHYPAVPGHFPRHDRACNPQDAFLDLLHSGDAPPVTAIDGYRSIAMLVAAEASLASGHRERVSQHPPTLDETQSPP